MSKEEMLALAFEEKTDCLVSNLTKSEITLVRRNSIVGTVKLPASDLSDYEMKLVDKGIKKDALDFRAADLICLHVFGLSSGFNMCLNNTRIMKSLI